MKKNIHIKMIFEKKISFKNYKKLFKKKVIFKNKKLFKKIYIKK